MDNSSRIQATSLGEVVAVAPPTPLEAVGWSEEGRPLLCTAERWLLGESES